MKKKTKYEIQDFLLEDLKEHHGQSSWDYPADHRFAVFLGDEETADILVDIMNSSTVWCFIIAAHEAFAGKIKRKRLTALRQLVYIGKVRAEWMGTGWGGKSDFGVNRCRHYTLR